MPDQSMPYRSLGRCGTKVSAFGLGGWTTFGESVRDDKTIRSILTTAFTAGINFFDIADVYAKGESERVMGKVLAELPRHELVISSKVFFPMSDDINDRGLSRKHIMESIDKTLQRIGTDYLDIYFCHRFDKDTPLEETARAMADLVHQGKVLYWGTSQWRGDQLQDAHRLCREHNLYAPQVEQPQYNLLARDRFEHSALPAIMEHGMGVVTWSPLESGILTGKYDAGLPEDSRLRRIDWLREDALTEDRLARVREFKSIADLLGRTRAQVALAWVVSRPGVSSVILGATRLAQLQENLESLSLSLDNDTVRTLDRLFPSAGRERS